MQAVSRRKSFQKYPRLPFRTLRDCGNSKLILKYLNQLVPIKKYSYNLSVLTLDLIPNTVTYGLRFLRSVGRRSYLLIYKVKANLIAGL